MQSVRKWNSRIARQQVNKHNLATGAKILDGTVQHKAVQIWELLKCYLRNFYLGSFTRPMPVDR